jgi:hypothetical protein
MRYFDNGNRLSADACTLEARFQDNKSISDYNTYNFFMWGDCKETQQKVKSLADEYPNLRFRTGYGVADSCTIDADNKVRYSSELTNPPERQQLHTRTFLAGPNFGRGTLVPNLESALIHGSDTSIHKDCHNMAEYTFGWQMPITKCTEAFLKKGVDVIPDELSIGRPSKDIFLEQRKKNCSG